LGALASTYDRTLDHPVKASRVRLHQGRVLFWVWACLLVVFLVIQAVRYLRLVSHDLDSLTSRVLGLRLSRALVALALLVPAVILLSPLAVALVLAVLFWPYQRPMEKLASVLLLGLAVATPPLADHLGVLTAFDQERAEVLNRAQYERCGPRCRARLDALLDRDPDDGRARFSKALVLFRRGTAADLEAADRLLSAHEFDPAWTEVSILEGNIRAARGELDAARQQLSAAAEQATYGPHVLAANLNLHQIYRSLGQLDRARAHLDRASDIDHDYVLDFLELSELRTNRWLVSVGAPPQRLRPSGEGSSAAAASLAADRVWRMVGGRVPRGLLVPALIVVGVIFGVGLAVRRRLRSCAACPTCGQVITTRDEPVAAEAGYCTDCYDLFVMGASLTSTVRREYELRVENHGRRQRRARTWGNLLGPGIGYLLGGATLVGLPLATLAIAGGVVLLTRPPAGDLSHLATGSTFDGRVLLGGLLLVLAYAIAWAMVGIGLRRGGRPNRKRRGEAASDDAQLTI
jgi:tetratricopeptide (TPR) repeat protein